VPHTDGLWRLPQPAVLLLHASSDSRLQYEFDSRPRETASSSILHGCSKPSPPSPVTPPYTTMDQCFSMPVQPERPVPESGLGCDSTSSSVSSGQAGVLPFPSPQQLPCPAASLAWSGAAPAAATTAATAAVAADSSAAASLAREVRLLPHVNLSFSFLFVCCHLSSHIFL
jgi:hypothetical protein